MNKKTLPLSAAHLPPIGEDYEEDRRHREPTIEELLASIRRIISEESELLETAATSAYSSASRGAGPTSRQSNFQDERQEQAVERHLKMPRRTFPARELSEERFDSPAQIDDETSEDLMSAQTASIVSDHFEALAARALVDNSDMVMALTQQLMKPMLKQWLDDHLPEIVERLVQVEIKRISRQGRDR
jgi:cell pole-organizing protein PopZ